jgi:hypothetical protein
MQQICDDLEAEHDALDRVVEPLSESQWDAATPAAGWSVRDQVSHLWFFDQKALLALTDPDAFVADAKALMGAGGGGTWTWGEPGAADSVRGPALDFCLAVTQRRHVADTALDVDGDAAREWMSIAQAFAGPPSNGRTAGQFTRR